MKARKRLTGRQAAFAQCYALTGNATRAAISAGYRNGRGIRETASRLLRDRDICGQVERLREKSFRELRSGISSRLHNAVDFTLNTGLRYREAQRAMSIMRRVGLFEYSNTITKEIREIEQRFGLPFEKIIENLVEAEIYLEEREEQILELARKAGEGQGGTVSARSASA
jgi:hypothetical protein